jgi:hypothetical protein
MKDLAKHMRRARVPSKRTRRRRGEIRDEVPISGSSPSTTPPSIPPVVQDIPDAWDTKHRPDTERAAQQARKELRARRVQDEGPDIHPEEIADAEEDGFEMVKRRRIKRNKKRNCTMGFAVSEEEEVILRAHVATLDETFSAWARRTLFRAAGKRIPARPKRG